MANKPKKPTTRKRAAPKTTPKSAAAVATKATPQATAKATRKTIHKTATIKGPEPAPAVAEVSQPVVAERMLRKKELIDMVVKRSGIKKKDAKPVVEAMLAVMGEALGEGRQLNLQPFGTLKVKRSKELSGARVLTARLRQRKVPSVGME